MPAPPKRSIRIETKNKNRAEEKRIRELEVELTAAEKVKQEAAELIRRLAGGHLPPALSDDDTVDKAFSSPNCFDTFRNYIIQKKGVMPDRDLIPALINIMNEKGFTITYDNFMELYEYLHTESKRTNSTKSIDARTFFIHVRKWFNTDVNKYNEELTRQHLTPPDISPIVKHFSPDYEPQYAKIDETHTVSDEEEYNYLYTYKLGVAPPKSKHPMNKKICGTCWLCGLPIYMYEYLDTTNNVVMTTPCGDDEHVIPPYIGNLFGTLQFDFKTTKKYYGNTTACLLSKGIKPAHKYCNMIKLQCIFIQLPLRPGEQCRINMKLLDLFITIFKRNLGEGYYQYNDDTNKYNIWQHFFPNSKANDAAFNTMKQHIISQLQPILDTLNADATAGAEKVCFSLQLKTIWFVCKMCVRMVNKMVLGGNASDYNNIDIIEKYEKLQHYIDLIDNGFSSIFSIEPEIQCAKTLDDSWLNGVANSNNPEYRKTIDGATIGYKIIGYDKNNHRIDEITTISESDVDPNYKKNVDAHISECSANLHERVKNKTDKINKLIRQIKHNLNGSYWKSDKTRRRGGKRTTKKRKK